MLVPLLKRKCAVYALLLVACCAGTPSLGAVLLPSQPTPASLVAYLQSCPAAATADAGQAYLSSSCAFLAPNSTFTLQPGPPATLPLRTTLIGAPTTAPPPATCCDPSNSTTAFSPSPQYANVTTNSTTTPPELDLAGLTPSSLVVPPNGTLSLYNLTLTAAQLPAAPYPLPASYFLSLLPIRFSPGARLLLSSVTITTPSCTSLALHQDLACRSAPSPNFTVTPTSLLVHSYTTSSLSAQDVLLTCSGKQLPAPCAAAVVRSGAEVLGQAWAWERQRDAPPAPLYLYVQGTVQVNPPDTYSTGASGNSSTADAQGGTPLDASVWEEVRKVLPGSTMLPISRATLVLSGAPDRSSVLQLWGRGTLLDVQGAGAVRLQHLTLRGLPLGPADRYPEALLRLPMWFVSAFKPSFGRIRGALLAVGNVTVELPPEEMAFWRDVRGARNKRQVELASPEGGGTGTSEACITDSGAVFSSWEQLSAVSAARQHMRRDGTGCDVYACDCLWCSSTVKDYLRAQRPGRRGQGACDASCSCLTALQVSGCSSCVLAKRLEIVGGLLEIRDTLLVDAAPAAAQPLPLLLPPPWPQLPGVRGGLRLPPAPSNPLCALGPGPGLPEAELLDQLIEDADSDAAFGNAVDASPSQFSPPSAPSVSSLLQLQLPPPLMSQLSIAGHEGLLLPNDLTYMLRPLEVTKYGAVLLKDVQVIAPSSFSDRNSFLHNQAVVELPGMLLLGDPLGIRTLDLSGFPSAVVLEREPLASGLSIWDRQAVLLPFLDTVRQQRQAAGLRGLLTEPVSLTVRHVVLINLPAAGPFVRVPPPPGAPIVPGAPPEEGSRRRLLTESPARGGVRDVRVAGRGLLQEPQPVTVDDESATGAGAGAGAADVDYLGGLSPSLANLTSCVWSLQLDRAAVVRAVRDRLQQGDTHGGGGAGDSSSSSSGGGGVQSPVDVSYVLLQSVQLVVPERELLLLAWAWATNATRHAAHPGLAEQLQLMLDGSRLAGGAGELLQQQLLQGPSGSPGGQPAPTLPSGLRLVYDQFVWCGLLGTNVTLTSQLPGPTSLSLQLPDLDLPVAYDTGFDVEPQGPTSRPEAPPPWVSVPSPAEPSPMPPAAEPPRTGPVDGKVAPTAGGSEEKQSASGGDKGNGAMQQPGPAAAAATTGGAGGSNSTPPLPLGAVVGLAVGGTAVLVGVVAGIGVWLARWRRGQARDWAQAKEEGCELGTAHLGALGEQDPGNGEDCGGAADTSAMAGYQQQQSQQPRASGRPPRAPRPPSLVLRHLVSLRLGVERNRQLMNGQQQEQQQQQQRPAELPTLDTHGLSHCQGRNVVAGYSAGEPVSKEGCTGGALRLGSSTRSSSLLPSGADTGCGSPTSVPGVCPGVARAGSSGAARDEGDSGLSGLTPAEVPSSGGTHEAATSAEAARGFLSALPAASKRGKEGSHVCSSGGGGGSSSGGNSGDTPLVLLRELGRGAQGVVYAGRWRGLDVAVKSVLVQRLRVRAAQCEGSRL